MYIVVNSTKKNNNNKNKKKMQTKNNELKLLRTSINTNTKKVKPCKQIAQIQTINIDHEIKHMKQRLGKEYTDSLTDRQTDRQLQKDTDRH